MSIYRRKLMMAYAANLGRGDIVYPGLIAAWSAKGKSNDDADRNVLKDLTGNGHDITLINFDYSGMSGYGGYNVNFLTFGNTSSNLKEKTSTKIIVNGRVGGYIYYIYPKTEVPSFKIKISGLVTDYAYVDENNIRQVIRIKEGEHILPKSYASDTITTLCGFMNPITSESTENGIIELLPKYPDALVFDGVDDYGINRSIPSLTDYTIIIKKKAFKRKGVVCATNGNFNEVAFVINDSIYYKDETKAQSNSFSYESSVTWVDNISYQTKNSYNGEIIKVGKLVTTSGFNISFYGGLYWKGAFYSAYLFDRSLDEQEIKSFIRKHIDPEYLLPSEIPTPDVYYDFTNGDNSKGEANNVIKDLSGNGNDAVAHNFAWNEEGSGYKDGALYFDGVDDYISLDAFDSGFKTIFMVCKPNSLYKTLYDTKFSNNVSVYIQPGVISYQQFNKNGFTYINGIKNTTRIANSTYNKKQLITVINNNDVKPSDKYHPTIGSNYISDTFINCVLYKFLGFKEALTEEQINAVIKKYNLLDGVDEIEVS